MTTKIFVGSLPSGSKPEELRHLFEPFGVVTECDVINRCGFIHMEKAEMAATAIKALNGTEFKGEKINVEPGRVRDRNQKQTGMGRGGGGVMRQRYGGGRHSNGMLGIHQFDDADFDGIDEKTTKDALQLCSAVFEEMNKLLNPDQQIVGYGPRRGGGGFPRDFVEDRAAIEMGRHMNRGPRYNRDGPAGYSGSRGSNQEPRGEYSSNHGSRRPSQPPAQQGPQSRGDSHRGNQGRMGGLGGNLSQEIGGRNPKSGNIGPIRSDLPRQQRAAPYNRGGGGGSLASGEEEINFADDVKINKINDSRNFSHNFSSGSQIDKWSSNSGNFGGINNHPMNRNFNEDVPVNNFSDDSPTPIIINMVTKPNPVNTQRTGNVGTQSLANHGNFGHSGDVGNDRFQESNTRFQGGSNDRFQKASGDRFQGSANSGIGGNFGNQDRRGFALPEKHNFNNSPKYGNQDLRSGGNTQFGGVQGNMGAANRNVGIGNDIGNAFGKQQNLPAKNNFGNSGMSMVTPGVGNSMFQRRTNNPGTFDGNNMGNNYGGNNSNMGNNRGMNGAQTGSNMNASVGGFNRNNSNVSGLSGNVNLYGPIPRNERNIGSGNVPNNKNIGTGGFGNNNNSNRNMGGNMGNNYRNNMSGGGNNNMNRNNMESVGGKVNKMNPMSQMNFQKDFPALPTAQNMNMNNRNGPRQNMMSNRRFQ